MRIRAQNPTPPHSRRPASLGVACVPAVLVWQGACFEKTKRGNAHVCFGAGVALSKFRPFHFRPQPNLFATLSHGRVSPCVITPTRSFSKPQNTAWHKTGTRQFTYSQRGATLLSLFFLARHPLMLRKAVVPPPHSLRHRYLAKASGQKNKQQQEQQGGGGESLLHGIAARQDLYQDEHLWRGSLGIISSGCNLRAKGLCSASRAKKNKTIATDAVLCRGGSGHTKHTHT